MINCGNFYNMQAVILAAGSGTRLKPLTDITPKQLLEVGGVSIIERSLKELPKEIDEIIIVIGYLGGMIKEKLGEKFRKKPIRYVEQKKKLGTAHALQICNSYLKGKFLVLMGDDIYNIKDIKKCIKNDLSLLVYESNELFTGNEVLVDGDNYFKGLNKVENKKHVLINTGLYVLDRSFFNYDLVKLEKSEEFGLPQTMASISKKYKIKVERAMNWTQINTLKDLEKANKILNF